MPRLPVRPVDCRRREEKGIRAEYIYKGRSFDVRVSFSTAFRGLGSTLKDPGIGGMELSNQKALGSTENCSTSSPDSNKETGAPANRSAAKSQSEMSPPPRECSMCGDVGFDKELFQCTSCLFRYQHTYCSSLYPKLDPFSPSCEWCIYFKGRKIPPDEKLKAKANGSPLKLLLEAVEAHGVPSESEMELPNHGKGAEGSKKRKKNTSACVPGSIPRPAATSPRAAKRPRGSGEEKPEDESVNRRNNSALERWRQITKNRLQNGSVRAASGRRYKLLADFLC